MATLFEGRLGVHYGYWWVGDIEAPPGDIAPAFEGQANGLLGGRVPGSLSGRTGLHTGPVAMHVEVVDRPGPLDGDWEDVVEASFTPPRAATLGAFEEFHDLPDLPAATWLRARLHARGMDEARVAGSIAHDAEPMDRYRLELWPEDGSRPDEVLRHTSRIAEHWHGTTGA